ncbi:alpha/beta fold hydrolase [Massilia sp. YIM B04103]|uniref:alpha/beta fold hydrolase n=1 Tax=Massilia sp. YIM B04103 TaxID=2963106 RepID=UPI00210872EF|nr:alpha/beta hydrolase [Massilia sp. YIM B04103]
MRTLETGRGLHCLDIGQGEAVLLLHGLGSCGHDWEPQIQTLALHYRIIAPDLRGHGLSPAPHDGKPWRMADLAQDVAELLSALELDSVHIIGFSLGGMVALELAQMQRATLPRIASLCLINALPLDAARPPSLVFTYWLRRAIIALFGLGAVGRMVAGKIFPRPDQERLRNSFITQMQQMSKSAYLAALDAIYHWHWRPRADALSLPVLILAADQDYTPVEAKRAFAAQLPDCRLEVIADSRHGTPLDQASKVNALLLSFLRQNITSTETR